MHKPEQYKYRDPRQRGAALIVGLVLMMVMTVLAVSTMSTSSLELTMAGNAQYKESAFQLAESGIANAWRTYRMGLADNSLPLVEEKETLEGIATGRVAALSGRYDADIDGLGSTEATRCLSSMGVDSPYREYHVRIRSSAETDVRNARALHARGFAACFQSVSGNN